MTKQPTTVRIERGDIVNLDSLGYYAYNYPDLNTWVGLCEAFPSSRVHAATGSAALNDIKALVLRIATAQANAA